ncbi:MAG: hypothetical protein CO189_10265 [candidate division Zixibacteria bacterium CG_4_9_14_3_um_filter_46_8]|nr:MAG: hypothetical protein CO189_10265 [candidate division Zixibacteria bacterium CG_4_9_14_3_um_filter_46_8]
MRIKQVFIKAISLLLRLGIPSLWIVSMMLLTSQGNEMQGRLKVEDVFAEAPANAEGQNWAGIYLKGDKIGYTYQSYQNSEKGILFKEYMKMRIPLGGAVREVEADNFALLDSTLSVRSFSAGMSSGEYEITIHGSVNGPVLELIYITGGKSNSKGVALSGKIYFQGQVPRLVKLSGFKSGAFALPVFDPLSMSLSDLTVEVGNVEIVEGDSLYQLMLEMNGIQTTTTIDTNGDLVKDEQPGGMMMVREPREKALALKTSYSAGEDFLVKLAVPSSVTIKNDRETNYLKAELQDITPKGFILDDGCTQRLVSVSPIIVEIDRSETSPILLEKSDDFLSASEFIQSNDSSIINLAASITDGSQSNREKAFAISDWVYRNIEKDITVSVPSAVEVLRVRRGDCNEHTVLYVALARAAGIPCKTVIGIVHKDGMFFYHAWPAVFLGYWHHLDPTFGQHLADATHIQLLEGNIEKQAELVKVVGKLKIKVFEYN